ncbi:hypothetical protein [Bacillus sp. AFS040349]|uniref:SHOCT-like domain-containing protein n=1 Tax=Bacillus sp. AFS040349 TaxID=2033502 RepID=UPI0021004C2D|nr:hypothetical protein [Bacillus sp. AFS040349]
MKDQKIRILKLVEEGKLSAVEALSLIESLENEEKVKAEKITALSTEVIADYNQEQHDENESNSNH